MHCTAVSSVTPFLRSRMALPMLRFASRAVKMTDSSTQPQKFFCCASGAAIANSSNAASQCSVSLSSESDEGRIGCQIACSGSAGVVVTRGGQVVFQSIKSRKPSTTYVVELCEGDVVALHSHQFPAVQQNRRIFSEHHDAEYIAEELLMGNDEATCVVGIVGRTEESVQPPERNF